jgi:molybdopterin biosynthesis enzyme MoaB
MLFSAEAGECFRRFAFFEGFLAILSRAEATVNTWRKPICWFPGCKIAQVRMLNTVFHSRGIVGTLIPSKYFENNESLRLMTFLFFNWKEWL